MVGMRHLDAALKMLGAARDKAALTNRQQPRDVIIPRMKEHQLQLSRLVLAQHAPGAAHAARRLVMLDHQHIKGRHRAIFNLVQRRPGAAVDQADGQVPQDINHMRANPLFQNAGQLCANTRQRCRRGKQRKNLLGAFWVHCLHGLRCLLSCLGFAS